MEKVLLLKYLIIKYNNKIKLKKNKNKIKFLTENLFILLFIIFF